MSDFLNSPYIKLILFDFLNLTMVFPHCAVFMARVFHIHMQEQRENSKKTLMRGTLDFASHFLLGHSPKEKFF